MRGDWLKIWIAWAPRSWPRSTAFAGPPAGETWAPMSMGRAKLASVADAPSLRSLADRRPAHRRGPDRAVQLAGRAPRRRHVRPAHRGHRPRALDARERPADPRRARVARARLRRGADLPVPARRAPRRGHRAAPRRRARLPLERRGRGRARLQ